MRLWEGQPLKPFWSRASQTFGTSFFIGFSLTVSTFTRQPTELESCGKSQKNPVRLAPLLKKSFGVFGFEVVWV